MRRLLLSALFILGPLAPAHAASTPDPCSSNNFKQSVAINQSSATTTSLVSVVAGHGIFVCAFSITIASSATTQATAQLEYGTGATCTSPTALTGTMGAGVAAANLPVAVNAGNGGYTVLFVPPGNGLCIVGAGTAVSNQGFVTFIQGTGSGFP